MPLLNAFINVSVDWPSEQTLNDLIGVAPPIPGKPARRPGCSRRHHYPAHGEHRHLHWRTHIPDIRLQGPNCDLGNRFISQVSSTHSLYRQFDSLADKCRLKSCWGADAQEFRPSRWLEGTAYNGAAVGPYANLSVCLVNFEANTDI
jgi:hypothetical protein